MFMTKSKMWFFIMLMTSTLIILSSKNWMSMWMGLEFNLLSFIGLISATKNKMKSQAIMMYFLTQSMSSMILIFSLMINYFLMSTIMMSPIFKSIMIIGLLIKVGAAPFHMWVPEIMFKLKWMEATILMTWQKLGPLFMTSALCQNNWMMSVSIILSSMMGAIGGLNTTSLKKIMAYSSISNMGWMLMLIAQQGNWYLYWIVYSVIVATINNIFNKWNSLFINQMTMNTPSLSSKFIIAMSVLSMGGLPPFLGFLPKWMVIQSMIYNGSFIIMLLMIMMSLITLIYYMRMISSALMLYSPMIKWMYKTPSKMTHLMFINTMLPLFLVLSYL
uniref:NADH-ubiquinone oxidoreductase chain 2 n=1 Tax=Phaenacantha marcida TaxID=498930 RepID=B7SMJ2_9HEMI|nr:NADH dehydrogenase subunit 2 [Phaenacantha marcida]ABZ02086.1 NADH dehydrogenase subunit 2 [Phaenacantha marcida]